MKRDYRYFFRRYNQIEADFLELTDFIELTDDFNDLCYQIGSSKMMDFCIKVGTEVETLFRILLESKRFDKVANISKKRREQNIQIYQEVIEPVYKFHEYQLGVRLLGIGLIPFQNFDRDIPDWFKIYSRYKHNKIELVQKWNMKHSLIALGCLQLLVINHPSLDEVNYAPMMFTEQVFWIRRLEPRFNPNLPLDLR